MLRQAPPLDATEAFLVASRSTSFRAAAAALALSPSAFSRRIQVLESFLGIALFDRTGPMIVLTPAGQAYREQIEPALDAIRRATLAVRESGRDRTLRIATSHSLAVGWLVPRLAALRQRHQIEVELVITRDEQVLRSGAADLAIWGGVGPDGAKGVESLVKLSAVPVAASRLADGRSPPTCPAEIAAHRLLGVRQPGGAWEKWLAATGADAQPRMAAVYETNDLMYEAAACGLGIALAVPLLIERFVQDGRLKPCMGKPLPIGMDYALFHSDAGVRMRPAAHAFHEWARDEMATSVRRFMDWCETDSGCHRELVLSEAQSKPGVPGPPVEPDRRFLAGGKAPPGRTDPRRIVDDLIGPDVEQVLHAAGEVQATGGISQCDIGDRLAAEPLLLRDRD
ncbi:MAG TPA: LysR substrate-binding domain-containing protein [Novosphingobium sp.]